MEVKTYEYLAEDAKMIRQRVFMQEQGFVDEFDDTDLQATQIVLYDEGKPIATCRIFPGNERNAFILGRLAVLKEYRGKNIGAQMLQEAQKAVAKKGGTSISLHFMHSAEFKSSMKSMDIRYLVKSEKRKAVRISG